jgi:hypothetical protein
MDSFTGQLVPCGDSAIRPYFEAYMHRHDITFTTSDNGIYEVDCNMKMARQLEYWIDGFKNGLEATRSDSTPDGKFS